MRAAPKSLETQTKIASDYTLFPLHPPLRNVDCKGVAVDGNEVGAGQAAATDACECTIIVKTAKLAKQQTTCAK